MPRLNLRWNAPPTWHVALIVILYLWQFTAALIVDYVVISLDFMGLGFAFNLKLDAVFALLLSLIILTIVVEVSLFSNGRMGLRAYLAFQLWKGSCVTALCIISLLEIATMSFLDLFYWVSYTSIYTAPFYLAFLYAMTTVYQPLWPREAEETGLLEEYESSNHEAVRNLTSTG